jgi:predicted HTH transcriptional regulator
MVPKTLSEWSIEAIRTLLLAGVHESEEFDFKEMLPHAQNEKAKARLRAACCAFANGAGGYIVFGIVDDRAKTPPDRLVGLPAAVDFPAMFGEYPKLCNPSVHWTFRNPPLGLPSGQLIQIVHIPPSWKAPHAYGDVDQGWRFTKRTNKGTEGMSIEEIRGSFLGFYEKRLQLQHLDAELSALQESASRAFVSTPEDIESKYSLITFSTQTIESVVASTYALTAGSSALLAALGGLRQAVIVANNKAQVFFSIVNLSFTNKGGMIREHNEFMENACRRIIELAAHAQRLLKPLLST